MSSLNRREFVLSAGAVAACAVCPDLLEAAPPTNIDVGSVAEYPHNVVSDKFKKQQKLLVVRSGDRIYAMSAVCTHRGCVVNLKKREIKCPCHGSVYSDQGTVTDGPAKSSLVRYAISLNNAKRLVVDKSKQFSEPQWEDPASFVTVS